jgi:drug/metabolite transporter (DMT)-like permease
MPSVAQIRAAFDAVPRNVQGMFWIVLSGLIFSSFMALVRLVGTTMDPIQVSFLRYGFGLLFLTPFFLRVTAVDLRAMQWKLHLGRGLMHGTGVMLWFYAMSRIPLAEVTAIGFTAPVFATVGAALFLGERIRLPRITAVVVGLMGALIIVRPGFTDVDPGAIAMLIAAPLFAFSDLVAKALTRKESGPAVVAYLSVIVTLVTLGPAISVWEWPTAEEWGLLVVIAGLATIGHLAMVQGFKVGEISAIAPARYVQLLWSALIGFALFSEVPEVWTWVGAAIIVAAAIYIARREAAARERGRQTVAPAQSSSTNTG